MYHPALCFSSSVIFLLVDACVGLNWLLVSFLSHVNKNIIHSFKSTPPSVDTDRWREVVTTIRSDDGGDDDDDDDDDDYDDGEDH